ncbi:hypothetical protein GALMADRAFT_282293 [Galerina marginata CBS 339.88]|uniref:Arrestin-like N-terminal domain-containing protein n=1 Tax=Galerina marginata (strain CBS 339.88) TaxID=685588 RepID=A0A067SGX3_GALM3|nr:hypothetical protein GALMADRAFT_282293 [Galerina marginata CBS 339.88]
MGHGTSETLFLPSYTDDRPPGPDLPAYRPERSEQADPAPSLVGQKGEKECSYTMMKGGHSFLVMNLISAVPNSQSMPIFFEGSPVKGKVQLHLKKKDPISTIVLSVQGVLLVGGGNAHGNLDGYSTVFLNHKHTVWAQEEQKNRVALNGDHTWPFSIDLPPEVEMIEGVHPKKFRLPRTFHQPFGSATIKYEIAVQVVRKGFLRLNDQLVAPIVFIPIVAPPPLLPLRRLAYEQGATIPGPKADPEGWHLQKAVSIECALFDGHSARAECRLFLAKPLSYSTGSVIPLFITFESDDRQLLHLLSSPQATTVRVRRHIICSSEAHKAAVESKLNSSKAWRNHIDYSQRAVWWHAEDRPAQGSSDLTTALSGELHLKPDMVPTTSIVNFRVNYSVVIFPFNTPGFKVEGRSLLLEQPITIVTSFAPGPRPRMLTPADYTPDIKNDADELQTNGEFSNGFY